MESGEGPPSRENLNKLKHTIFLLTQDLDRLLSEMDSYSRAGIDQMVLLERVQPLIEPMTRMTKIAQEMQAKIDAANGKGSDGQGGPQNPAGDCLLALPQAYQSRQEVETPSEATSSAPSSGVAPIGAAGRALEDDGSQTDSFEDDRDPVNPTEIDWDLLDMDSADMALAREMLDREQRELRDWHFAQPGNLKQVRWQRGKSKQKIPVEITICESPYRFFVRETATAPAYDAMDNELQDIASILIMESANLYITKTIRFYPCCAKYEVDKRWYRAIIWEQSGRAVTQNDIVHVFFVDYGNLIPIKVSDLLPLPIAMTELRAAALQCRLKGASQTHTDNVACTRFKATYEEGKDLLIELKKKGSYRDAFFEQRVFHIFIVNLVPPSPFVRFVAQFHRKRSKITSESEEDSLSGRRLQGGACVRIINLRPEGQSASVYLNFNSEPPWDPDP